MQNSPEAGAKDQPDSKQAEWGSTRHEGYKRFSHSYLQPSPLFFTRDHHPLWLADTYRARSVFLICGGPSFATLDHTKLRGPGIMTMGLNNSPRTFRPHLWCSVDSPDHWIRSIWLDPCIQKFVPISHVNKKIFNSDKWKFMRAKVGDCPNVVYYKRNEKFQPEQFLWEDTINWGNHKNFGGGRSVMLAAIRILFTLGFRRVYLLGCDFKMDDKTKYHFDQDRHKGSIKGNNETYRLLNDRFKVLRPLFEAQGFHVFNCNPESNLTAFQKIPFSDAIGETVAHMDGVDYPNERTKGLYETKTEDKERGVGA